MLKQRGDTLKSKVYIVQAIADDCRLVLYVPAITKSF